MLGIGLRKPVSECALLSKYARMLPSISAFDGFAVPPNAAIRPLDVAVAGWQSPARRE
jgi:hypothetical protein